MEKKPSEEGSSVDRGWIGLRMGVTLTSNEEDSMNE
jgi:hypothetical protein